MDKSLFSDTAAGIAVRLEKPFNDWAFIPAPLPPKWNFDRDQLGDLLGDAREELGTLNGIGQTLPDPELLVRPLQGRESISSSSIEGTFVTPEQLLLYELDPSEPDSPDEKKADWMEVYNYNRALRQGCEMIDNQPITNHTIRSIHATLMTGVRGKDKSPGQYRNGQVQIGSNARYVPPPPHEIERLMDNFIEFTNSEDDSINPLVKAFIAHYQFEAIHPFTDGKGRIGRALLSMMIYKWQEHVQPWLYLSPFFEKYKDEYVRNMFRISTSGDWNTWIEFCLRGTVQQSKDAIARCHRFRELRAEFPLRVQSHSPRTHTLIESLFRNPILSITEAAETMNVTYHTAKGDIDRLLDCGILTQLGNSRPKRYYSDEIVAIAYRETAPLL